MKIADNSYVSIDYRLALESGEEVDRSPAGSPLGFVAGTGSIIPGLESALMGREAGEDFRVTVEPEQAYGPVQRELLQIVPVTNVWLGFPFMMVIALGALQSIPHDLYEAADIDGAGWFHKLKNITIPLIRRYVDDLILVSEGELTEAIRFAWTMYHERIEASAAVSLAAILSGKISARPAVVVISGGNIQPEVYRQIVEGM